MVISLKKRLSLIAYLLAIWLVFVAGALVCFTAPIAGAILALLHPELKPRRIQNIVLAMDRLNAALLGWSGLNTISGECGADNCTFCKWLCKLLNGVDVDHCTKTARNEGLLKEG